MIQIELSEGAKNGIAILLLPLSTLVLLTNEVLYQLSLLADADPGIIDEVAPVIGWVVLVSAVAYLLVGLRRYLPVVDFRERR
ncbi:hypothetical protein [Natrinema salaciae]|uniref:Uncharacterized protein n=1 Tax=Natrinema salaciae TaxID=1186196 RepID=A0A1H9A455_9EURY|nr:hypothetical protein [Natrinema salaciae]SEP71470.1 hypothetical protein SAMN04489841_0346 [Natrinema salaciae]